MIAITIRGDLLPRARGSKHGTETASTGKNIAICAHVENLSETISSGGKRPASLPGVPTPNLRLILLLCGFHVYAPTRNITNVGIFGNA